MYEYLLLEAGGLIISSSYGLFSKCRVDLYLFPILFDRNHHVYDRHREKNCKKNVLLKIKLTSLSEGKAEATLNFFIRKKRQIEVMPVA